MPKHVYSCLMADDMVAVLCLREGRWQPEAIAGEISTLIEGPHTVPALLDALNDRLNLKDKLASVQFYVVYASTTAALLPDAIKRLAALGCTPYEILRLERAGGTAPDSSASDIMEKLAPGSTPLFGTFGSLAATVAKAKATADAVAAWRTAVPAPVPPRNTSGKPGAARFFTVDPGGAHAALIYDGDSGLLWASQPATPEPLPASQAAAAVSRLQLAGLTHWRVPERHELSALTTTSQPLLGKNGKNLLERWNWLCTEGRLDVVKQRLASESDASGYLLPVLDLARGKSVQEFTELARERGWQLAPWSA
jgi:hypothetical protein